MRSAAVLLFAALTGSAISAPAPVALGEGYAVPDLGDGVFMAGYGKDGLVNITRVGDPGVDTSVGATAVPTLERRALPITGYGCYSPSRNHDEWESAAGKFAAACEQGYRIPGGYILFAITGNSVAYGCSWGGENTCSRDEFSEALGHISQRDKCRPYVGGYIDMGGWKKQYGVQQRGESVCGWGDKIW